MSKQRLMALALVIATAQVPFASQAGDAPQPVSIEGAVAAAIEHVRANHQSFGLTAGDVAGIDVTDAYRSAHNGVAHVYLRQRVGEVPVLQGTMSVGVLPEGRVFHMASRFIPGVADDASGSARRDAVRAVVDAAAHLDLAPTETPTTQGRSSDDDGTLVDAPSISRSPIPARLVYEGNAADGVRLAWNLQIEELSGDHWWNVSIDAESGALLAKRDLVVHDDIEATGAAIARPNTVTDPWRHPGGAGAVADGSSYRVFALPLESPNDGDRTLVVEPADPLASPYGWHDTDGSPGAEYTITQGNTVHAYADWTAVDFAAPGLSAEGGSGLDFDHALDPTLPPQAWRDAAITNLFYWNNIFHDVMYRYGFDEAAGNFQWNNYGPDGIGLDHVLAEGQDHGGVSNANFATPQDGRSPRMQMYIWPNTNRRIRDGDLDAGVIVHEYGHGVSNRLTGGPAATTCLRNEEQAGEGWSDFLAIAMTAREGDSGVDRRGLATYSVGEPGRDSRGIRPLPYSTALNRNNATYNAVKSAAVPHGVGWVWATMLWEMYWGLVDVHGFNADVYGDWNTGGNNLAIQLVLDGMKLQPCSPGFVDARDAIVAADVALTSGANECAIWAAFAKRGLGYSADQGFPASVADGTQAFDLPPVCT